jgi:hypothetical protein
MFLSAKNSEQADLNSEQNIYSINFNEFMQKGQIAQVGIVRLKSCLDHVFRAVSHLIVDNVDIQKKSNLYDKINIFISTNYFYRKFQVVQERFIFIQKVRHSITPGLEYVC